MSEAARRHNDQYYDLCSRYLLQSFSAAHISQACRQYFDALYFNIYFDLGDPLLLTSQT